MDKFYFTKIPNMYIKTNIKKDLSIPRRFYAIYAMIDRNRTRDDRSHLVINEVFDYYNYKKRERDTPLFRDIIYVLHYMGAMLMIDFTNNITAIPFNSPINIKINSRHFDPVNHFTILPFSHFDTISEYADGYKKDILLLSYLYIVSYINNREGMARAFYRSREDSAKQLGLSMDTLDKYFFHLVEIGLLKRNEEKKQSLGKDDVKSHTIIYVLNETGYKEELERAEREVAYYESVEENRK